MPQAPSVRTLEAVALAAHQAVRELPNVYSVDSYFHAEPVKVCRCEHPVMLHDLTSKGDRAACSVGSCSCWEFDLGFREHTLVTRVRLQADDRRSAAGSRSGERASIIR